MAHTNPVPQTDTNVTQLLSRWSAGDPAALQALIPLVYAELRRLAAGNLARERAGHTLQPTALVHEAYLRLVQQHSVDFDSRLKFYAAAAQMMRRVLCDRARHRNAKKRGDGAAHLTIDLEIPDHPQSETVDLERLDDALSQLEQLDPRKVRIVELRYFAGLSIADAAVTLALSPATIKREWSVARAWLASRLRTEP